MDTLCGIGLPEIVIIALVGFVLIGPARSQELALRAGRFLRNLMRSAWWHDFNQVATAIRDLPNTLVRMAELEEAQADLRRTMHDIESEATIDPRAQTIGRPDGISDPWGIRNASAQTQYTPRPAAPEAADEPDSPASENDPADA